MNVILQSIISLYNALHRQTESIYTGTNSLKICCTSVNILYATVARENVEL